MGLVYAAS
jgi:hypothetical protein